MKKYILISLLFLTLPFLVFGAVSYERSPGGYYITNPINFDVSFEDFIDTECSGGETYWGIAIYDIDGNGTYSEFVSSTTLSYIFSMNLPEGEWATEITFACSIDGENFFSNGLTLEYDNENLLFSVANAKFVPIHSDFIPNFLAYIEVLFTDLTPVIILIIGLPLAFWSVKKLIGLVRLK